MDHYQIWFNIKDTRHDLAFVQHLNAYLDRLKADGRIVGHTLMRRKLGFGPAELGEFHVDIHVCDLAQLDTAFDVVAAWSGEIETLHARVWSMVTDFRSALYRDFPDPQRVMPTAPS